MLAFFFFFLLFEDDGGGKTERRAKAAMLWNVNWSVNEVKNHPGILRATTRRESARFSVS